METPIKKGPEISINDLCRVCANQTEKLTGIYSSDGLFNDLANKINLYLPIKISETDDLPLQCCWHCVSTVLAWHNLVVTSRQADKKLRSVECLYKKSTCDLQMKFEAVDNDDLKPLNEIEDTCQTRTNIYGSCDFDQENSSIENNNREMMLENVDKIEDNWKKHSNVSINLKKFGNAVNLETKTCNLCSFSFVTKTLLKAHMSDGHNLREKKTRRKKSELNANFMCPGCDKSFTRKYDMQKHIINKHPNENNNIIPSKRSKNETILEKCKVGSDQDIFCYQCDLCKKKFKYAHSLFRHRNIHTSERLYFCHICGNKFIASNSLVRHINQLHYGIKKFGCDICKRKFSSKTTRDEHINIHTNNRPFVCPTCGKSFKQNSSLRVHKMFHSNVFRHVCNICRKKFRRKHDLKVHQSMHTGEKPHQCQICKVSFRLQQDLKRHLKIHSEYFNND